MTTHPSSSDPNRINGLIAIGGASQPLVGCAGDLGFDFVLASDTSQELAPLQVTYANTIVAKWTLASQETVATLLTKSNCSSAVRQALAKRPGIGLGAGLGQIRRIGHLAGTMLADDDQYRKWIRRDLLQQLLMAHPRGIERFDLYEIVGGSGATASGACQPIEDAFVAELAKATGARLHLRRYLIGLPAYLTLGDNVAPNAGCTTAEAIAWAASADRGPKVTRMLTCLELPSCQQNDVRRKMFTTLTFTATLSHSVETILDRIVANESLRSAIGAVVNQRTDYFHAIDGVDIADSVARSYLPEIRQLRSAPVDPHLVREVGVELQTVPRARPSVEAILEECYERSADEVVSAVCQSGERLVVTVGVELTTGDTLAVDRLTENYLGACRSPSDVQSRMTTFKSIARVLGREVKTANGVMSQAEATAEQSISRLNRSRRLLLGQIWYAFIFSNATKELRFLDAAREARDAADTRRRAEAEHQALERAATEVASEIQYLDDQLAGVQRGLERLIPKGRPQNASQLVNPLPLAATFERLLQATKQGAVETIFAVTSRAVESLTLAGLAATVGAESPRLADVVEAIRRPIFAVEGPVWGCQPESNEAPLQITVLPPVRENLAANLGRFLQDVDPQRLVAFSDTAQTGVIGAVHLSYRFPRLVDDLVTPILRHAIAEALAENPDLFFPRGTDCLDQLGLIDAQDEGDELFAGTDLDDNHNQNGTNSPATPDDEEMNDHE